MNKKYHIIEVDSQGNSVLWITTVTGRAAYEKLDELQARFKEKKFRIEVHY